MGKTFQRDLATRQVKARGLACTPCRDAAAIALQPPCRTHYYQQRVAGDLRGRVDALGTSKLAKHRCSSTAHARHGAQSEAVHGACPGHHRLARGY